MRVGVMSLSRSEAMEVQIGKKLSAWSPVIMSIGALVLVGVQIAVHGTQSEQDEGALAHVWQLLILGQVPIIGFFVLRWLRAYPRQGAAVLAAQVLAAALALVPVHMMGW
jgi:hypothetical protein